jgi:hypothetical protein
VQKLCECAPAEFPAVQEVQKFLCALPQWKTGLLLRHTSLIVSLVKRPYEWAYILAGEEQWNFVCPAQQQRRRPTWGSLWVCRIRHTEGRSLREGNSAASGGLFYLSSGRLRFHRATRGWRLASWFLTLSRPTQPAFGFNYLSQSDWKWNAARSCVFVSRVQLCVFKVCTQAALYTDHKGPLCPTSAKTSGKRSGIFFSAFDGAHYWFAWHGRFLLKGKQGNRRAIFWWFSFI